MKIYHIVSTYPPYKGGMGNVAFEQVKRLSKDHEMVVLTPKNKKGALLDKDYKVSYVNPIFKYGNACFVPQIKDKIKDADIVHLHWPFIGGAETILFKRILGNLNAKLVVQYHMDLIDSGIRGKIFSLYTNIFAPIMVRAADKILVSSLDYIKHSHIKPLYNGQYKDKFIDLPLGVNTNRFYPKKVNNLLEDKVDKKDKILLLVAGLDRAHYFKGVGVAIKAMANLDMENVKLVIVGEGKLKKKYKKQTAQLGVSKKIVFAGRVSDEKLPDFYNVADGVILPSTSSSEAFGLVLLEGMACKKPILVSNLPGPRSLVEDNGFVVKVGDQIDLAQKIKDLFSGPIKKFSKNSLQLVNKKYEWDEIVKKLERIYNEL